MRKTHSKVRLKRLRVKKRSKKVEKFTPEKIQKALEKETKDKRFASQTTRDVVNKILRTARTPVIASEKLFKEVIKELKKKNKKLAKTFENNHRQKRKVYKQRR